MVFMVFLRCPHTFGYLPFGLRRDDSHSQKPSRTRMPTPTLCQGDTLAHAFNKIEGSSTIKITIVTIARTRLNASIGSTRRNMSPMAVVTIAMSASDPRAHSHQQNNSRSTMVIPISFRKVVGTRYFFPARQLR